MRWLGSILIVSIVLIRPLYAYSKWFRYLIWKWKAIPHYERAERRRQRLCEMCGYDIRATPNQCPECGAVVRSTN